jgi:CheY-like chemotaxis protein
MIRNLLSNAIRYTARGSILVGCRCTDDKVCIEVRDSGAGIAAEHIAHIFDEYYQGPESADHGGVGLGLAIVQQLGKLLGHRVDVRSVTGKGSVFSIEVPLVGRSTIVEARSTELQHTSYAPLVANILIIEDENSVRRALDNFLRAEGLSVQSVASGSEALTLVTKNGLRPDLVISDYNLPGKMNGIESIEALRVALAWKIPGIVLTGDIRSHVTESIATHGLAVAPKPFDADELLQLIKLRARSSAQG